MALRYNEQTGMFDEVPENPQIISFTYDGPPIKYKDETVVFHWDIQDAQRVYINEKEMPQNSLSYSYPLSDIGLQDFVLRIENGGNQKTETIQIKILDIPVFNVEQSAEKIRKGKGEHCIIKWNIQNAQSVKLITNIEEDVPLSSEFRILPEASSDYKFEAVGLDGNRLFTHTVHVDVCEESIVVFSADKNITLPHVPVKLVWDVRNASETELLGFGVVEQRGIKIVECDKETTFTLKVTDAFGTTDYHQTIRMYPLPLIRSILVPMPQIKRKLKVETHLELKHLQVNLNVRMTSAPQFNDIKTDVFVPCMRFHELSFKLDEPWKQKIEDYKRLFRRLLISQSNQSDNSVFEPSKSWWNSIREHRENLTKCITNKISILWNR